MDFLSGLTSVYIPSLRLSDIFEIFLLVFLIYKTIMGLRNTRVKVILKGILVLFIFYNIAYLLNFEAILVIFQSAITILIFAIIVVFQPEMRKFLEQMGTKNITGILNIGSLFKKNNEVAKHYSDKTIVELTKACYEMGDAKTGALIVIERKIPLTDFIESGIKLNADISSQLYLNIFEKNTPLHDGAVIQVGDKIVSATSLLPLTDKRVNKKYGTRHRAALGLSEQTDSLVIVVSEETGYVSLAVNGKLEAELSKEKLTELLKKYQSVEEVHEVVKDKIESKKIAVKSLDFKKIFNTNNMSIKIVSFVIGVVGWVLLISISNPVVELKFENVPITLVNTNILEDKNQMYEITSDKYVDVVLKDRRSIIDKIHLEDIKIIADFSKLSYVNAIQLEGKVLGHDSTEIKFKDMTTLTVELDTVVSKEIPIEIKKYSSNISDRYVPILYSDTAFVMVTGGKTKVETIDKLVYTYDVTGVSGVYEGTSTPTVFDKNGDILDSELFKFNIDSVIAYGESYPVKEVILNVSLSKDVVGDYKVDNLTFEPTKILVAGSEKKLKDLKTLDVVLDLNLTKENILNNEYIKSISVSEYLPEGVYFVGENDEVTLTMNFETMKTTEISIDKNAVSFVGLGNGLKGVIEDSQFTIVVTGEEKDVSAITSENLKPYVDVSGLPAGKYNMIMQFEGLDNVILTSNISVKLSITEG